MTKEQKIEWLKNASNRAVIDQIRWAVLKMTNGSIESQIEGQEDYELVTAELERRLDNATVA